MMKFNAPAGASSITLGGIPYFVEDGRVEVPAQFAGELSAHGFTAPDVNELARENAAAKNSGGFGLRPAAPFAGGLDTVEDDDAAPIEDIALMDRQALFAYLKGEGVAVAPATKTENLRQIALTTQSEKAGNQDPLTSDQGNGHRGEGAETLTGQTNDGGLQGQDLADRAKGPEFSAQTAPATTAAQVDEQLGNHTDGPGAAASKV